MKKKLRNCAGFSLVEMLCAVAILTLLCLMVSTGLSAAMKTYFGLTAEAETQLLLNSVTNAIAAELRCAHDVSGTDDPTYNDGSRITLTDGKVYAGGRELLPREDSGSGKGGAYKNGEYSVAKIDDATPLVQYADGCFTINLKVVCQNSAIGAEAKNVVIRCLNPPKEEGTTS